MKKIEIKSRFNAKVIFAIEAKSLKIGVELAVRSRADLYGADLSRAYLSGAYLSGADLSRANLSGAYLSGADLSRANLSGADLSRADLYGADLSRAYLSGAYLYGADLSRANLSGADLSGANLSGANLSGAYLSGAKKPPINSHQFASEILWRKAKTENQKNFSARIRIETNKCWNDFYVLAKKMKVLAWAKKTLHWQEYQDKIKELEGE